MQNITRNNHYVPQFYLKRWKGSNGKIHIYSSLVSNEKIPMWKVKNTTKSVGSMDDLYTRIADDIEIDDFESEFDQKYENGIESVIEKIENDQRLVSGDWKKLLNYLALQMFRTPVGYMKIIKMAQPAIKDILENLSLPSYDTLKDITTQLTDEEKMIPLKITDTEKRLENGDGLFKVETIIGKSVWLFAIKHFIDENGELIKGLNSYKWSIVSVPVGKSWPTSDNPVAHIMFDNKGYSFENVFLDSKKSMIIFPLTPNKVLIGTKKRFIEHRITATSELYDFIFEVIVKNSNLFVYHNNEEPYVSIIKPRTVDAELYKSMKEQYNTWYESYKEMEVPYLNKNSAEKK